MRPFTSTISLEEARKRLDAHVRPIERTSACASKTPPDAWRRAMSHRDRRAAVREIGDDGYAVIAADTQSASRSAPPSCDYSIDLHGQIRLPCDTRHLHGNRDRARCPGPPS